MTTSKKKSTTKPSTTRQPSQTPSTNRNRFETFAVEDDDKKLSYSKVTSSNRVTDMPPSDSKPQPSSKAYESDAQDDKLDTLLSAFQSVTDRLKLTETTVKNMDSRFSKIENTLENVGLKEENDDVSVQRQSEDPTPTNNHEEHDEDRDRFHPPKSADHHKKYDDYP